jgi:PPM family protein phosphatase
VLCSDGLSDVLKPPQIRNALLRVRDPQKAAERLVALAVEGGGPDNITVIVVDTEQTGAEPDTTGDLAPGVESATGAMPAVADPEAAAARRDGRAARAAKDRSLRVHRRLQRFLMVLIVVALVAVAVVAGRSFLFSRYWVGFDGDSVAVFQGVPGDVAGLHFSRLVERSPVTRDQVPSGYAARLDDGVPADNLDEARRIALCAPLVFSPGGCAGTGPVSTTTAPTTTVRATTTTRAKG